jgi:glycosyltransferase involved in cell wall biosynthesis
VSTPEPLPRISVIICTRNRPQDISLCLPTVLECEYPDFDVVLIDQSTDENTAQQIEELGHKHGNLDYLHTSTVGKSIALNLGIARAKGEILAFTDDDCEVTTGWLSAIAQEFASSKDTDIVFGPVLPSPALDGLQNIYVPSWSFTEARDVRPSEICGMGANMALRRRVLSSEQGPPLYDALLGPGAPFPAAEEGDFCYRLRLSGARAALRPSLRLYHRAYRTTSFWQKVVYGYGMGDAGAATDGQCAQYLGIYYGLAHAASLKPCCVARTTM